MGKMAVYMMVFSGILLLFYFGGLLDGSASTGNLLLNALLSPQDIGVNDFLQVSLTNALLTLGLGGIAVGLVLAGNLDFAVLASIALFLQILLMSFIDVFSVMFAVNEVVATLFLSPFILLMIFSVIEWWGNRS